jgi:hypothetical protein
MPSHKFPVFSTQGDGGLIRLRHVDWAELRAVVKQGLGEWIVPGATTAKDQKKGVKLVDYEKARSGSQQSITLREMNINAGLTEARDEEELVEIKEKVRLFGNCSIRHILQSPSAV